MRHDDEESHQSGVSWASIFTIRKLHKKYMRWVIEKYNNTHGIQ